MEECSKYKNYIIYGLNKEAANRVYSLLGRKLLEKDTSLGIFDICDAVEQCLRSIGFNYFKYDSDKRILRFGLLFPECKMVEAVYHLKEGEQIFYRLDEELEATPFTTEATVWGEPHQFKEEAVDED